MTVASINGMPEEEFLEVMLRCCGSRAWGARMLAVRPYASFQHLAACAELCWWNLPEAEWLLAFSAHPRIGGGLETLREKYASSSSPNPTWEGEEQSGTKGAEEAVLQGLYDGNQEYEARFGHVFLICATGQSADKMLAALRSRKDNTPQQELLIAAGEQAKIAQLRLAKLLSSLGGQTSRL